jgi:1,5-anhydro-D-fructose reductase (1,5-anhydro-D-mannitol-forming)
MTNPSTSRTGNISTPGANNANLQTGPIALSTVRWGMVGIGKLADAAIAPAIALADNSELVAVCSRDATRADNFAERHGAGYAFDDFDAMLADDLVQVVYISSPNAVHHSQALAALRAGKHVLVDKPLALTAEEGRSLVDAATEADVRLAVGFHLRHKQTNVTARQAIAGGAIGAPAHFQMLVGAGKNVFPFDTWRTDAALAGGGTLLNQGTHGFDLVEFISSSRIVEVSAIADVTSAHGEPTLEEVFVASCRLENGALATVSCDQVLAGTRRDWTGVGSEGWLEGRGCLGAAEGDAIILHRDGESTTLASSSHTAYEQEVADFSAAILADEPVNGDGVDGLRSIVLVEALYRSAREGRRVEVATV